MSCLLKPQSFSKRFLTLMYSSFAESNLVALQYSRVLESLPCDIEMAFAYGSGVFQQQGHSDMKKNMLDFVCVVNDPLTWHQKNIKLNPKHYSCIRFLGARNVARLQDKYSAGVYFNTMVPFEDRLIKYGVISTDRLISDLLDWDTLYISGRLHKPIKLLITPNNKKVLSAMHINLQSAVHASLLILPEFFSEEQLYETITGLSYSGDFRMTIGEDKNKVQNIVRPNMYQFRMLYEKILDSEEHVYWNKDRCNFEQYPNYISQYHHLSLLPKDVQARLVEMRSRRGRSPDLEEVLRVFAHDRCCDEHVAKIIADIVWRSSLQQSFKTIFTAGLLTSLRYSTRKLKKMF